MDENKRRSRLEREYKDKSNRFPAVSGKFYLFASIVQLILLISFIVFFVRNFEMKNKLGDTESDLTEYKKRIVALEIENSNFNMENKFLNEEIVNLETKIQEKSLENNSLAKEKQNLKKQLNVQQAKFNNIKIQFNDLLKMISQTGLPKKVEVVQFKNDILNKIKSDEEKRFIQSVYIKSDKEKSFIIKGTLSFAESIKLRRILDAAGVTDILFYEQDISNLKEKIDEFKTSFEN